MTLSIPSELSRKMKKHKDIKWSSVVRSALEKYIKDLDLTDKLLKNSELSEEEAMELGNKLNKSVWKKHYAKFLSESK